MVSTSRASTRLPGRTKARTEWPSSMRTRATCQPRNPLAPVTREVIVPWQLAQRPGQHFQIVGQPDVDPERGRWFESAVHHTVLATRIVAGAVALPRSLRHQRFEGLIVPVGDQIAR